MYVKIYFSYLFAQGMMEIFKSPSIVMILLFQPTPHAYQQLFKEAHFLACSLSQRALVPQLERTLPVIGFIAYQQLVLLGRMDWSHSCCYGPPPPPPGECQCSRTQKLALLVEQSQEQLAVSPCLVVSAYCQVSQ